LGAATGVGAGEVDCGGVVVEQPTSQLVSTAAIALIA
jgi:hypothetical protein